MFKLLSICYDNTKTGYKKSCFVVFLLGVLAILCCYDILKFSALVVANCVTLYDLIIFIVNYAIATILCVIIHPSMEIWYKNRESYRELRDTSMKLKKQNLMGKIKKSIFYRQDYMKLEEKDLGYFNFTSISCLILIFLQSFLFLFVFLSLNIYGLMGFNMPILLIISTICLITYLFLHSYIKKTLHELILEEQDGFIWVIKAGFYLDYFNNRDDYDNPFDDNEDLE